MEENNYISKIFLDKDNYIGCEYIYNSKIEDYSLYHTNINLKVMILLYYFNEFLQFMKNSKTAFNQKFYLINTEYLDLYEKTYEFNDIHKILVKNSSMKIFVNNLNKNITSSLTERQITIFTKSLVDKNKNLNKKGFQRISSQDEPNLIELQFNYNNNSVDSLYYYNDFKIIDSKIYDLIFLEGNNQKNNYTKCFFVDGLLIIRISEYLNKIKYIYELGELNEKNIFMPKYILIYNDKQLIYNHLQYINNNIKVFINNLNFKNGNSLPLIINGNNIIGMIINISIKVKIPTSPIVPEPIKTPKPIIINPKDSIRLNFKNPPLIGLQNVGATCYMNATLQCLCQIEKLVDFFKYKPQINEVEKKYRDNTTKCLSISFKYLIENLWPSNDEYIIKKDNHQNSNNKYFAPYEFKKKISIMNKLFKGAQANDSKDLVNFIIMTLHEELNKAKKDNNNLNNLNNLQIDQTNQMMVFNIFANAFMKENQSIISDIFYSVNGTSTQCSNCQIIKYNFQTYFFLIFPLEEVRKMKIMNFQNQFNLMNQNNMVNPILLQNFQFNILNMNSVNIYDCFEYNQKMEYFTGENSMYCNNCKIQCPASYFTSLYTTPEVLIIVLNRGKGIEFNVKLEFEEDLNLQNFVHFKQTGFMYKLIGVVTHLGESGASGHFIAYARSPIDNLWYRYNDDIVSKVINTKKEIIDYAMPYILFFQKIN